VRAANAYFARDHVDPPDPGIGDCICGSPEGHQAASRQRRTTHQATRTVLFSPRQTHNHKISSVSKSARPVDALTDFTTTAGWLRGFSQLQKFCHLANCESYLEALYLLCRLVEGAVPALVTPASFEPTPLPIVCPQSRKYVGNRPHLCLVLGKIFQFFQVSMLGSRVYRVDVLEWCEGWRVIELDGQGHSNQRESERERVIGLPTQHLSEDEVVELGWGLCRRAA